MPEKFILDACCGGRMFWFNKHHPNALYIDNRIAEKGHIQNDYNPNHEVKPDILMDFRDMKFDDNTFELVVFDPPHMKRLTETSVMRKKFGCLNAQTWKGDLRKGFSECWRVLKEHGILIFKWCEEDIMLKEVLQLAPMQPLFGHTTGSKSKTHWLCFMKITKED